VQISDGIPKSKIKSHSLLFTPQQCINAVQKVSYNLRTPHHLCTLSHIHRKTSKVKCQLWNKSSTVADFTQPASQIHPTTINESQVLHLLIIPPLMYISVIKMLLHPTDQNCAAITGHLMIDEPITESNPLWQPTRFLHAALAGQTSLPS
jgi:hypothetical protein